MTRINVSARKIARIVLYNQTVKAVYAHLLDRQAVLASILEDEKWLSIMDEYQDYQPNCTPMRRKAWNE